MLNDELGRLLLFGRQRPYYHHHTARSASRSQQNNKFTTSSAKMMKTNRERNLLVQNVRGCESCEPLQQDILAASNMDTIATTAAAAKRLPRARKKIKMREKLTTIFEPRIITRPIKKNTMVIPKTNYTRKPPEPQGAFFYHYKSTSLLLFSSLSLFVLLLALCILVSNASRTTAPTEASSDLLSNRHHDSNQIHTDAAEPTISIGSRTHYHHGLASRFSSVYRHLTNRKQREHEQQDNKLKYLIAKTSSIPQMFVQRHYEQPSQTFKHHHQPRTNHMDNNIVEHNKESPRHPSPVQHTISQPFISSAIIGRQHSRSSTGGDRRNPFLGAIYNELDGHDHDGLMPVNYVDPLTDAGDSFDADVVDFDVVVDVDDDDGDLKDNNDDDDVGADGVDDDDDEDDEYDAEDNADAEKKAHELEGGDYATHFDGDSTNYNNDQNTFLLDEPVSNKEYSKKRGAEAVSQRQASRYVNHYPGKYSKLREENEHGNQSFIQMFNEPLKRPHWRRNHIEIGSESRVMVTTANPVELQEFPRRRHHSQKQKSQPPAPYQSPVVVSISDNSFVSASPISMGTDSVNDVDDVERSPKRPEGATVHYSHIIAGPKNELLPSNGKSYWHDSHMASIRMVQEVSKSIRKFYGVRLGFYELATKRK